MKKYIISSLLFLGILSVYTTVSIFLGACSSDDVVEGVIPKADAPAGSIGGPFALFRQAEKGGISIDMKTKSKTINGNAMKAGESFSKEYSLDLGSTFEKEYGLDAATIATFYIDSVVVKWTSTNMCSKLASYSIKIESPDFVAVNENSTVVNTKIIERDNVSFPCNSSSNEILTFKDADFKQKVTEAGDKPIEWAANEDDKRLQYEMLTTNFAKAIKENKAIKIKLDMKTSEAVEANSGITIEIKSRIQYLKLIEGELTVPIQENIVIQPSTNQPKQSFVLNTALVAERLGTSFDMNNLKTAVIDQLVISNDTEVLPITGEVQIFAPTDFYTGDNVPRKVADYKKFVKFGFWSRPVKSNRTDIVKLIKDKTPVNMELGQIRSFSTTPLTVKLMANIKYTMYK